MLNVILWKWRGWRPNEYTSERINVAARMIREHLHQPHKITCITDDPEGITECSTMTLWKIPDVAGYQPGKPNCWVRLRMYSAWARQALGERIMSVDADLVVLGRPLDPLVTGEDLRIFEGLHCPYNGSLQLHTTGTRTHVWDNFDPRTSPRMVEGRRQPNGRRWVGSDQAWLSLQCPGEATYTPIRDGVGCKNPHQRANVAASGRPRIIFFPGRLKPWHDEARHVCPDLWRIYRHYSGPSKGSQITDC